MTFKKLLLVSAVVALWAVLLNSAFAAVSMVLPNGGECLTVGQAYTITITSAADHTALYYRTDGAQPTHLDSSEIKHPLIQTTWSWTPTSANISETGRIWVEGHLNNHNTNGEWDQSDNDFAVRSSCAVATPSQAGGDIFLTHPSIKNVTVSEITTSSAVIKWQTDRATYYRFSYGPASGDYSNKIATGPPYSDRSDHILPLRGLKNDTTYYFKILAGLYQPEPVESDEYTFKTLDQTPPAQARHVFGIAGASTTMIAWLNPTDSDFKETVIVRRSDRFPQNRADGAVVFVGDGSHYTDSGLTNGKTYYYSIFTADRSENVSIPVNLALTPEANLPQAPEPPAVVSTSSVLMRVKSVSATAESNNILLRWTNPEDKNLLGIQIVRNTSSLPADANDGTVVFRGRTGSFRDSGLKPGTRYNYGFFAFDWRNEFYQGAFIGEFTKPATTDIEKLLVRIEGLNELIRNLKLSIQAAGLAEFAEKDVSAATLRFGAIGEEVEELQKLLAKDPAIYPEGLVTGYFGPLTRAAVQRFQRKFAIVSGGAEDTTGYGAVGPNTSAALALFSKDKLSASISVPVPAEKPAAEIRYVIVELQEEFSPKTITVPRGATVEWINRSGNIAWPASAEHPTHRIYPGSDVDKCDTPEAAGIFDACRPLEVGEVFSFVFEHAGSWKYHDHIFPDKTGTVIVVE
ncbi:MAG: fibronectin type III domain-containing protein [Patescibacteria group bacterium]